MQQTFRDVELTKISPSPLNPRKNFKGPKFDELVQSIEAQGVLEPILLRPHKKGFEIVAGERRFRAATKAAEKNDGVNGATIPAMVRELTDDQAFEIMTIENLQREDLNELEEARSFKTYLERKGDDALPDLAEKTGIKPRYIRRRVTVLTLPKYVLKAWEKGDLVYGHLEQFMRLDNSKDIKAIFGYVTEGWDYCTVSDLRREIDRKAPSIKNAVFDTKKSGCKDCRSNSTVQKKLWDMDGEKAMCLDPKCYKGMVADYLTKNWKQSDIRKQCGTNGFRFRDEIDYNRYESMYWKIPTVCKKCEELVTIINIDGSISTQRVCTGEKGCTDRTRKAEEKKKSGKTEEKPGPRVEWHGSHFRDEFYQRSIPEKIKTIDPDDLKIDRLTLYHLLERDRDNYVTKGIIRAFDLYELFDTSEEQLSEAYSFWLRSDHLWEFVSTLDRETVRKMIREASLLHILSNNNREQIRGMVAEHMGIDLATEYEMDEEYLKKKTKAEMMEFGESLGIFSDEKVKTFLFEKLLKKRGKFTACKKGELIKCFLESGVDLKGKVPAEILGMPPDPDQENSNV